MNMNRWFGLLFALSCLFWASNSVVADDAVGVLRVDVGTNEVVEVEMPFEIQRYRPRLAAILRPLRNLRIMT